MTESTFPKEVMDKFLPEYVVPLVGFLASEECEENGTLFEVAGGYISKLRYQRTEGALFDLPFTAEDVKDKLGDIISFDR